MAFINNKPIYYGPPAPTPGTDYRPGMQNPAIYGNFTPNIYSGPTQPGTNADIFRTTGRSIPSAGSLDLNVRMGNTSQDLLSSMAPTMPASPGLRPLAKIANFGSKVSSFFAAANPIIAGIGAVAGFFSARKERRRMRREARARKERAMKSEDLLVGAAKNVVARNQTNVGFLQKEFQLADTAAINKQMTDTRNVEQIFQAANVAGSGSQDRMEENLIDNYSTQFDMRKLGYDRGIDSLARATESELRGIQNNLLELSAYSKRNISVLDMIGGSYS